MPQTPDQWFAAVRGCERDGELFRAYDLAMQGLAVFPDDLRLKYRAVLCLASTGARKQAAQLFDRLALDGHDDIRLTTSLGLDIAALRPRLLKDEALATHGNDRAPHFLAAADAYAAVYQRALAAGNPEAYYPGVNGATLYLLAGRAEQASALAREVLATFRAWPPGEKSYYEAVSELEAELVLGDLAHAQDNVRGVGAAIRESAERDYRGLAGTVRQLRLIVAAKGLDADWLGELSPSPVIHFLGHIIAAPGQRGRFPADPAAAAQ
ncbi:MAG: tetratricopeptide repeat-containing protein, partial [Stellaceae bacterium]